MFLTQIKSKTVSTSKILIISLFILLPFNLTYSQKGGYADKLSVAQGETLTLYISSDVTKFPISIFKMGASVQFIMESDSVIGIVQSVRDSFLSGLE